MVKWNIQSNQLHYTQRLLLFSNDTGKFLCLYRSICLCLQCSRPKYVRCAEWKQSCVILPDKANVFFHSRNAHNEFSQEKPEVELEQSDYTTLGPNSF